MAPEAAFSDGDLERIFSSVLDDAFHYEVRQLSAGMLEEVAHAHWQLPERSLHALASGVENQLASAKQYHLQSAMISLLVKASAFDAMSREALQVPSHNCAACELR